MTVHLPDPEHHLFFPFFFIPRTQWSWMNAKPTSWYRYTRLTKSLYILRLRARVVHTDIKHIGLGLGGNRRRSQGKKRPQRWTQWVICVLHLISCRWDVYEQFLFVSLEQQTPRSDQTGAACFASLYPSAPSYMYWSVSSSCHVVGPYWSERYWGC